MCRKTSLLALLLTTFSGVQGASANPPAKSVLDSFASPTDVVMGDPTFFVAPEYPREALDAKIQGTVVLRLTINKNGKVKSITLLSGDPQLADAALRAVKKWEYAPYLVKQKRVEVQTIIGINFKADDLAQPEIVAYFRAPEKSASAEIFKPGNGVTPPKAIYAPDPDYPEGARKQKYEGTCVISLVVSPDGRPYDIHVQRAAGMGLDDKAIAAVRRWRFEPGTKDGKPVAVRTMVEVAFRLY